MKGIKTVKLFLNNIEEREKKILEKYYETYKNGRENMSLVAKELSLSRERVRQILNELYEEFFKKNNGEINIYKSILISLNREDKDSIEAFFVRKFLEKLSPNCKIREDVLRCPVCNCVIDVGKECSVCQNILTIECKEIEGKLLKEHAYNTVIYDNKILVQIIISRKKSFPITLKTIEGFNAFKTFRAFEAFLKLDIEQIKKFEEIKGGKPIEIKIKGFNNIVSLLKLRREKINVRRKFYSFLENLKQEK